MTVTRLALVPNDSALVTEPDLIARVVAGDRLAARALYDAHVGRVHRLAYRLTGDQQLAEEVVQDTFVRAIAHLGRFRGDCALATWLHRITVTVALNARRGSRRREERETTIDEADGDGIGVGDDGNGNGVDPILRDRLHRAIDGLPEMYRTVVVMHDFEGYSHVEIAEVLGIPVGTCRSRLFLARAQLRVALGDLKGEIHG